VEVHIQSALESSPDDPVVLRRRESEVARWMKPAVSLYTGRQHTQMLTGVKLLRPTYGDSCCDVAIVSAGYGLINESHEIAPYIRLTFQQQPKPWIRKRGVTLGVPSAIRALISKYA
jgi:hypothetical protein